MKSFYTAIFFAFIFLNGTAQQSQSSWLSHVDTAKHFSFRYPENWTLKLPGTDARFIVTSPRENNSDDFRENLNFLVREAPGFKTGVPTSAAALKEALQLRRNNFVFIDSAYVKWNNVQALRFTYSFTSTENSKEFPIEMMQQLTVLNGVLFTLTYTAKAGSFTKFLPVINQIIQSVVVH